MSDDAAPTAPALLGPIEVRELAERLGVSPTKKLGQNFVIDPNTVRKIVRLAGVEPGDRVIEVGPGLGSLTLGITEAGADVTAVEIDHRLAAELPSTVRAMQPGVFADPDAPRFRVIRSDALELTAEHIAELPAAPEVLVANLPYNVSVPILMQFLELMPSLRAGLVMVQAEVGYRIAAGPGSKEYGAPSAKAAWYGEWGIAGTVSRRIFWPVPNVDSVLVSYVRSDEPRGSESERVLTFSLVNSAFAQRRKMLRQSMQPVLGPLERAVEVLEAAGVDPMARAEQVSIDDFHRIARVHAASEVR
ncbi:16S rRNA (adenine(1518)-N(6)/adenine(1519)-N(6))-dimethyltransferase [Leucobacter sp. OLJS4]|uniref:16S rRNA (adenine(1518)-N(6)/adenine(1519)-N(6))- dimethyltransferase RsmA n=1 Tax=unclassified Leucobacter TaxID=2621730 RepID=UPI000C1A1FDD|nr:MULTISPECIES: 16S rRNA (adenine(1518)-N(6)/adenine(1519)-N(6))-dimethyltransferase RsmA [unclassified Leucobacter]PII82842.1 16S rRNA (adenine(1518)-N(6)/adenine(1519)-N(6))-dimethyltransferase [Leucobacter sp. OLCALW19]PII88050.1 16S rRNA (adenine(1518)-N(6)/adenine(1519)-N(6))-dimethyltransferase [Leucobacter sp. OLTLW20]PII91908.1 16S rRNA (adenine(1518)-N(6)/adenine(1519)-N(6))-dimethyltransferase [Leucobacter sp. OLAS13]PIJ00230.1 16S rRNA (adenine(1518)-N(6)/adenine(1519)-N(6))-dimethy